MKKTDPITGLHRQAAGDTATQDLQRMNASTQQKQREPRAGHRMWRLWLPGICGLGIVIGGAFLVRSRGAGTGNGDATSNAVAHAVTPPTASAIASAVTEVSMRNLQFHPVAVKLRPGDVVEWRNDDLVPHTASSASFSSGTIVAGQSWRHTFTNAGKFPYVCSFHPQMKGVVIVK
jgi:plastocyanin